MKRITTTQQFTFLAVALLLAIASQVGLFSSAQAVAVDLGQTVFVPVIQPVHSVSDFADALIGIQQTKVTELNLRSQVAELEGRLQDDVDLAGENKWLREQLSLGIPRESTGVFANVVRYEYSPNVGYLYLNVGGSLVAVNDVVIVNRYVIGEIVETYDTLSKVRVISANQTEIPVRIGNGAAGILRGKSGLELEVTDIDAGSNVQIGDEVRYLTPLGADVGKFLLGKVTKVHTVAASPTQSATIETPLDLFNLQRVIVIPNQAK